MSPNLPPTSSAADLFAQWIADNPSLAFQSVSVIDMRYPSYVAPYNALDCATELCANKLAALIPDLHPFVLMDTPPELGSFTPFVFTGKVAWLVFPNGLRELAGPLASDFTHGGYNNDTLLRLVRWNVAADAFSEGLGPDPGPFAG